MHISLTACLLTLFALTLALLVGLMLWMSFLSLFEMQMLLVELAIVCTKLISDVDVRLRNLAVNDVVDIHM